MNELELNQRKFTKALKDFLLFDIGQLSSNDLQAYRGFLTFLDKQADRPFVAPKFENQELQSTVNDIVTLRPLIVFLDIRKETSVFEAMCLAYPDGKPLFMIIESKFES